MIGNSDKLLLTFYSNSFKKTMCLQSILEVRIPVYKVKVSIYSIQHRLKYSTKHEAKNGIPVAPFAKASHSLAALVPGNSAPET